MKNELKEARWYKLAFKNNLQLTEDNGKVGLLGSNKDWEQFNKDLINKVSFEDFLEERHYKTYPTLLDDDISDHYDAWRADLESDDLIMLAEEWCNQ